MKIIDLLVKIANGKNMPLSFRYEGIIWVLQGGKYYQKVNDEVEFEEWFGSLLFKYLNDEIEIIKEDKKIEKLNLDKDELLKNVIITAQDYVIEGKINEIIDEVNKLKGANDDR